MTKTYRSLSLAVLFSLLLGGTASAQIIGPGPKKGKLHFGAWYSFKALDTRIVVAPPNGPVIERSNSKSSIGGFAGHYGLTNNAFAVLTFGMAQHTDEQVIIGTERTSTFDGLYAVFGGGLSMKLFEFRDVSLRLAGQYDQLMGLDRQGDRKPTRTADARAALTAHHKWRTNGVRINGGAGLVYLHSVEKSWTAPMGDSRYTRKNTDKVSPAVSAMIGPCNWLNLGLELTFGAITDFRWRTEIQL